MIETSSLYRRVAAYLFDSFVLSLCLLPVWIQLLGSYFKSGELSVPIAWLGVGLLLQLFYKWIFLYFLGATPGKLMMGLRVISIHNPEAGLGLLQSFLRVFTDALSLFFGQALRALALIRLDRTHVSDWVAETRVVQFVPLKSRPTRHWILALVVMFFSFISQFQNIYHLVQRSIVTDGEIILDADY